MKTNSVAKEEITLFEIKQHLMELYDLIVVDDASSYEIENKLTELIEKLD
jgi:hypothetical protein